MYEMDDEMMRRVVHRKQMVYGMVAAMALDVRVMVSQMVWKPQRQLDRVL